MVSHSILLLALVASASAFQMRAPSARTPLRGALSMQSTWQQELDELLDIDTPLRERPKLTGRFMGRLGEVSSDVFSSVRERNLSKLAPRNLSYGRSLRGIHAFRKQLATDLIPDMLRKGVPKLVEGTPGVVGKIISAVGPQSVVKSGRRVATSARTMVTDREKRSAALAGLRRDVKNTVRATPEGLQTPMYDLFTTMDLFEFRRYEPFSVVSVAVVPELGESSPFSFEPLPLTKPFGTLNAYLQGANLLDGEAEKLPKCTPVIIDDIAMSFVLPDGLTSRTAPVPTAEGVTLRDVKAEFVASRDFTGLATEGEVARQRATLEDALIAEGVVFDVKSFRVMTYNSPLTVPWVRRNEVSFAVKMPEGMPLEPVRAKNIPVEGEDGAGVVAVVRGGMQAVRAAVVAPVSTPVASVVSTPISAPVSAVGADLDAGMDAVDDDVEVQVKEEEEEEEEEEMEEEMEEEEVEEEEELAE
ncbi:regulatory factor, effector binding domain-containing protein [Ochromonadaceae sp. CCMP2298]|nr:regulatory factor, effector binding domain-containing protein [Ochromonadaceae sp. CCMP2298]|mmetsp:Transcript_29098/g.65943  ORF Transcript_29098/g.65943 Transcript_29098/m.65943 type:complete len:473 (-) Transcript_29098:2601-4019(-)|eukprot:CAMPEP_0173193652 /NCGR_PEP_ID=MMETSP1141-20130122/14069_1 /TAXON_ID=483371 /ORGANISM="non described non described, Strain CCMP2298" /LENGTH=472 /DNA_ID=CAMNT_0014117995 /DNA_START=64 /DNA_END=1482 /DNA_ORIENTATION=-